MLTNLDDLNNTFNGGNLQDEVHGLGGRDRINGRGGDDLIFGEAGNDTLNGEAGNDTLYGGDDSDTLQGGGADDLLFGDAGNDSLAGGGGQDQLKGGDGNDRLDGNDGNDVLDGGTGLDILRGGAGSDRILLDVQDLNTAGTGTVIDGGGGTDTLEFRGGQNVDLTTLANSRIRNVEIFDLEDGNAAGSTRIRLNAADVAALNGNRRVIIDGDAGDEVLLDGFTNGGGTQVVSGKTYAVWQSGRSTAWVDQDVVVNPPAMNHAPVVNDQTLGVAENSVTGTVVGTVAASDSDADALAYSISSGNTAGAFAIHASTGQVTVANGAVLDFESQSSYALTVQVADGKGGVDTAQVTINLSDVNEPLPPNAAPVITSNGGGSTASINVAENITTVTTVIATDADAGETIVYSVSGGADAARFSVDSATGALSFNTAGNFELPDDVDHDGYYEVQVRASSSGGLSDTQDLAIRLTNQNEAPVIVSNGGGASASINVQEGATSVTSVLATDQDLGEVPQYTISGGADAALFSIHPVTGALSFNSAQDFDNPADADADANGIYQVQIKATTSGGLSDTQDLSITVQDVNEAPSVLDQAFSVDEQATTGTVVGSVLANDPDSDTFGTLTYSITAGNSSGAFAIDPLTGKVTVTDGSVLDYETQSSYVLGVQVQDGGMPGLIDTAQITINLNDIVEFQPASILELSDLQGTQGFRIEGSRVYGGAGANIQQTGDINGDGFADILARAESGSHSFLAFGGSVPPSGMLDVSSLDGSNGFRIEAFLAGVSKGIAGDVNGDNYADLSFHGAVVFGAPSGIPAVVEIDSLDGSNGFRREDFAVGAIVGDFNGDGYDDLIGRAESDNGVSAAVLFGRSEFHPYSDGGEGGASQLLPTDQYPTRLAAAGDFNGDGLADVALSSSGVTSVTTVVLGRSDDGALARDTSDDEQSLHIYAPTPIYSLSTAGDVNGDGYDDLILGAEYASPNGNRSGAAYVVFGRSDGVQEINVTALDGTNGFRLTGTSAFDAAGSVVSNAGDINGDGYDDLLIAAPGRDANGIDSGAVYVVFGQSGSFPASLNLSSLDGYNGFRVDGEMTRDFLGSSDYSSSYAGVGALGDIDGDGFDDFAVSAPDAAANELAYAGVAYVIRGSDHLGLLTVGTAGSETPVLADGVAGYDGRAGDDVLTGNAGDNTLIGGLGSDTLDGAAGNDVLIGAAGDDVLIYDAADTLRVDGGSGTDTLRFGAGTSFDFNPLAGSPRIAGTVFTGIEVLDIANGEGGDSLTLDLKDVLNLSDTTNDLIVKGDAGDSLTLSGGFLLAGEQPIDGEIYDRYVASGTDAVVFVDGDVDVGLLNSAPINLISDTTLEVDALDRVTVSVISVLDRDAGNEDLQVTLTVESGTLYVLDGAEGGAADGLTSDQIVGNRTDTVTLTGSQAAINANLHAGNLVYTPATIDDPVTLTITTNDLGHSGIGGPQMDIDTLVFRQPVMMEA